MTQTLAAIVIVAFAAYRLAAVIALDTISEPFRVWVYERGHHQVPPFVLDDAAEELPDEISAATLDAYRPQSFEIAVEERKAGVYASGWHWLYGLISCPFCCGWWLSIAGWWAYTGQFLESRVWVVQAVAVAGVQSAIPGRA